MPYLLQGCRLEFTFWDLLTAVFVHPDPGHIPHEHHISINQPQA